MPPPARLQDKASSCDSVENACKNGTPALDSTRAALESSRTAPDATAEHPADVPSPGRASTAQHIIGSTLLFAWVLTSPHPFPELVVATMELYTPPSASPTTIVPHCAGLPGDPPWTPSSSTLPLGAVEREGFYCSDGSGARLRVATRRRSAPGIAPSNVRIVALFDTVALDTWCVVRKELSPLEPSCHW
ncbi:hypothetical protein C8F04DRAFT_1401572 [Mycena alexandri]|uniref:Uncharacterized protein n=1 Tax=Mycena alexandri TaxID=1745969 RepID=A0AAD6S9K8_9AGAR|nr:hypothetical protein C8F04DRAFT_1401572 [Mycena alexandri]